MPPATPLVLLPTFRIRDALLVLAVVERMCDRCGHVEPVDVIGLATHAGTAATVMGTVAALTCARYGHREGQETVTRRPPSPQSDVMEKQLIQPAEVFTNVPVDLLTETGKVLEGEEYCAISKTFASAILHRIIKLSWYTWKHRGLSSSGTENLGKSQPQDYATGHRTNSAVRLQRKIDSTK